MAISRGSLKGGRRNQLSCDRGGDLAGHRTCAGQARSVKGGAGQETKNGQEPEEACYDAGYEEDLRRMLQGQGRTGYRQLGLTSLDTGDTS